MFKWVIFRGDGSQGNGLEPLPPPAFEFDAPDLSGAFSVAEVLAPDILMEGGRIMSRASYDLTNEELAALRRNLRSPDAETPEADQVDDHPGCGTP